MACAGQVFADGSNNFGRSSFGIHIKHSLALRRWKRSPRRIERCLKGLILNALFGTRNWTSLCLAYPVICNPYPTRYQVYWRFDLCSAAEKKKLNQANTNYYAFTKPNVFPLCFDPRYFAMYCSGVRLVTFLNKSLNAFSSL